MHLTINLGILITKELGRRIYAWNDKKLKYGLN